MESQYASKKELQQEEIEKLKKEINSKGDNINNLSQALQSLKEATDSLQKTLAEQTPTAPTAYSEREQEIERMRKAMAKDLADFESMKKALMRDLQLRCEKVVELEMSLDETREQYNNVLRASNNKAQQQKMAILERNLEQLKNVQKQVIIHKESNSIFF